MNKISEFLLATDFRETKRSIEQDSKWKPS